jgi:predicted nucleotidyltransferase
MIGPAYSELIVGTTVIDYVYTGSAAQQGEDRISQDACQVVSTHKFRNI